jgi:competence protein ComEC
VLESPQTRIASSPLFVLAALVSLGILAAKFSAPQPNSILIGIFIVSIGLAFLAIAFIHNKRLKLAGCFLMAAFFLVGALLSQIESRPMDSSRIARRYDAGEIAPGDPLEVTAGIVGEPEPAPESFYVTLQVESVRVKGSEQRASGVVLLMARTPNEQTTSQYQALALHHGARIRVLTMLDRETDFRNPGVSPFTEYLERKGYDATGVIKSPLLIERLDDAKVFLPLAWLYQWRARLQSEFNRKFSPDTAGVLNAAMLGNSHNVSRSTAERFRAGGTFHILVISGMQIAFIAGIAFVIVRRITRKRLMQFILASGFLWAYTIAVGAEASVTRAAMMFTIAAFAPVVARKPVSLNTIGAAALVLLICKPSDLFDPSFQLTFLSVLAIICVAVPLLRNMQRVGSWRPTMITPYPPHCAHWFRVLSEMLYWREREWKAEMQASNIRYRLFKSRIATSTDRWRVQKPLRFLSTALIVSTGVQIVLLLPMVLYFHRISVISLVLNVFVSALMAVLAGAALAAVLLSQTSATLAGPLVFLAEKSNWLIVHLVDPFSRIGMASIRLPHYSGWWAILYALYYIPLGYLVFRLGRWDPLTPPVSRSPSRVGCRLAFITLVILLVTIVLHPFSAARPDGNLHVDFLDVGQGDAALLTLPNGVTVMVDGGGQPTFDRISLDVEDEEPFERDTRGIGERVVSEYLWSRGLDRVDYLIATHADADHIDGLNDVARNFKVRGAIVARTPSDDPEFLLLAETLKRAGIAVETVGAGDLLKIGDVAFEVLWPPSKLNTNAPSRNNDSVMLRVRLGTKSLLLTGDIEKEGESMVLSEGVDLQSDVVKVAHHGSKTSSIEKFVNVTRPSLAVISVGRTSMFGHPHKEVVERWRASGAQVMTTGEKGTISVVTDGRDLKVTTFVRE